MKKILTIISLFVSFCISAGAQTLFNFAEPVGTANPNFSNISYSNSLGGMVITGSYTAVNMFYPGNNQLSMNNIMLVKPDGSTENLDGGITDGPIIKHLETSDGTNWAITPHSLWKLENTNWVHVALTVNDSIKNFFEGDSGALVFIGKFTIVNGTVCQHVIRFNQLNQAVDTVGFGDGLPNVLFDPGNFVSVTKSDSVVYFTWNTGFEGTLWKYNTIMKKLTQIIFPYQINYVRVIEFSNSTNSLYCFTVAADRYLLKLSTDNQWTQVLLFDQDVFSITSRNNELYMSGFFTSVNAQPINTSVKLNETSSIFTPWNTNLIASIYKTVFFQNGNMLGLTSWELVSSFEITDVVSLQKEKLKIYPNPATTSFSVDGVKPGEHILLSDILGNTISTQMSTGQKIVLEIENLSRGIYFLSIGSTTQKIILQ